MKTKIISITFLSSILGLSGLFADMYQKDYEGGMQACPGQCPTCPMRQGMMGGMDDGDYDRMAAGRERRMDRRELRREGRVGARMDERMGRRMGRREGMMDQARSDMGGASQKSDDQGMNPTTTTTTSTSTDSTSDGDNY